MHTLSSALSCVAVFDCCRPLPPDELSAIIHEACGDDNSTAMLTQVRDVACMLCLHLPSDCYPIEHGLVICHIGCLHIFQERSFADNWHGIFTGELRLPLMSHVRAQNKAQNTDPKLWKWPTGSLSFLELAQGGNFWGMRCFLYTGSHCQYHKVSRM